MTILSLFEIDANLNMEEFEKIFTNDVKQVITVLRKYGFDIRIVGGAVRDFIKGVEPRDIDFATDAEPAELIFIFDIEGIKYDAIGIAHGTIKAVFGENKIDITSIHYRLELENNKVEITRLKNWEEDSARRDITINSMSVDMTGKLYDYQGGYEDLKNQLVKFCPNPIPKIEQDPYTVLRWFKALSIFENPKWIKSDRLIIENYANKVESVLKEKRTKYLFDSLKKLPTWKRINKLMCETGVAQVCNISCN